MGEDVEMDRRIIAGTMNRIAILDKAMELMAESLNVEIQSCPYYEYLNDKPTIESLCNEYIEKANAESRANGELEII